MSQQLGWPLIDKDDVKDILDGQTPLAGTLAYDVMARIVHRQVAQGLSVICDSPLLVQTYDNLRAIADGQAAILAIVECRCSDEVIWRQRVEARRSRNLPAHHTVTWDGVQRFLAQPAARYPIIDPHLIVDTARQPPDQVEDVLHWLAQLPR